MRILDLFSGIGGFSLGLERAGMRTVAFCEIDPYCRAVLKKHWPDVPQYTDVRELTAARLAADGISVDVICGGFPCQDISVASKGAGLAGERSGLWREYARLVGELRPRYVIVENVAALLGRGLGEVLGDLAALGYDAEWHCIPAFAVGVPQARERIWIVAYPAQTCCEPLLYKNTFNASSFAAWIYATSGRDADTNNEGGGACALSILGNIEWTEIPNRERSGNNERLSAGVDRYKQLGNTVVPQIPEIIGRAIVNAELSRPPLLQPAALDLHGTCFWSSCPAMVGDEPGTSGSCASLASQAGAVTGGLRAGGDGGVE